MKKTFLVENKQIFVTVVQNIARNSVVNPLPITVVRNIRSSHRRCSVKKVFLETLLKKGLWHRCFSENFGKFARTSFLQNTSGQLLLDPKHGEF